MSEDLRILQIESTHNAGSFSQEARWDALVPGAPLENVDNVQSASVHAEPHKAGLHLTCIADLLSCCPIHIMPWSDFSCNFVLGPVCCLTAHADSITSTHIHLEITEHDMKSLPFAAIASYTI